MNEEQSVLARYAASWKENDLPGMLACYHDEFALHYFGHNDLSGVHQGKRECIGVLKKISERTRRKLVAIVAVMEGADCGALVVRESLERDGRTAIAERILRYRMDGDLLRECWVYDEDPHLVDWFYAAR